MELSILTDRVVKSALPSEKAPETPRYLPISPIDHLKGPDLFPGEETPSSSGKAIAAIKAYSEHIVVKIVIDKDFVLNRVAL